MQTPLSWGKFWCDSFTWTFFEKCTIQLFLWAKSCLNYQANFFSRILTLLKNYCISANLQLNGLTRGTSETRIIDLAETFFIRYLDQRYKVLNITTISWAVAAFEYNFKALENMENIELSYIGYVLPLFFL